MMRTATNVAGQALVPVIVAKRQGILDIERYRGSNGDGLPASRRQDEPTGRADRSGRHDGPT